DEQGLDIGAAPQGEPPPRLVYTTPSRQYPLGMAMPLARRMALLAWAEAAGAWIIEDDYESEFQRPAQMLPSLQGLDRAGRVIYLGTFSKLVFPALRLGYAVLPEDLVGPFTAARHLADRQSSSLLQAIMTEFMLGGHFARHLKLMRAIYAERQAFLIAEAERRLAHHPAAGLRHVCDRVPSLPVVRPRRRRGFGGGRGRRPALVGADPRNAAAAGAGPRHCRAQRGGDRPRRRAHGGSAGREAGLINRAKLDLSSYQSRR